ncbi:MAG: hypothetical protein MR029_04180 [Clostridium sp.]|nr:hypothetical protein [Clostridium sp.]
MFEYLLSTGEYATESDIFREGIRSLYREKTEPDKVVDWGNRIQECATATADVMMERMKVMLDGISIRQDVMPSAQADSNSNNHENDCEGMKPPEASEELDAGVGDFLSSLYGDM